MVLPGITTVLQQLFMPSGERKTVRRAREIIEDNDKYQDDKITNDIQDTHSPIITQMGKYNVELVPFTWIK